MKKKILVTYQIPKDGLKDLERHFDVYYPESLILHFSEMEKMIDDYDGIITVFGHLLPPEIIKKAKKLKIISNFGAGVDNIPVGLATEKGILVTNTPDAVTESTAELAISVIMAALRRIPECDRKIREGIIKWGIMENLGRNMFGKTLGIVGMGKIGKATAARAIALGMSIVYNNRNRLSRSEENKYKADYLPMDTLLDRADVVSLHIPLTDETRHLIGYDELKKMKPDAWLVNTARGAVVDEQALIKALQNKLIAGAALDVFEHEPDIPDEFLTMENVVLLPHVGTATMEARIAIARSASENIIDFFSGQKPKYMVNPGVLNT